MKNESEKMRKTMNNGRANKTTGEVYLAGHDDRQFDLETAEHINAALTKYNKYYTYYPGNLSFQGVEKKYYTENYSEAQEAKNERYRANRHPERCKSIDDLLKSPRTCPEETIYQVGKMGNTIEPELLDEICKKQLKWEQEQFPQVKILDAALHVDEATPHVHVRKVWEAQGKDGLIVSQTKALEQMGVERPDMTKPKSRYNNAKMTYTHACREHFQELCKEYDLEIETEPQEASKSGLTLKEYQRRQEEKKLKEAEKQLESVNEEIGFQDIYLLNVNELAEKREKEYEQVSRELEQTKQELESRDVQMTLKEQEIFKQEQEIVNLEKELVRANTELTRAKQEARQTNVEYQTLKQDLKDTTNEFERVSDELVRAEKTIQAAKDVQGVLDYNIEKIESSKGFQKFLKGEKTMQISEANYRQYIKAFNQLSAKEQKLAETKRKLEAKEQELNSRLKECAKREKYIEQEVNFYIGKGLEEMEDTKWSDIAKHFFEQNSSINTQFESFKYNEIQRKISRGQDFNLDDYEL